MCIEASVVHCTAAVVCEQSCGHTGRRNLSFVVSSPLRRCVQTAIAALRRLPTPETKPVRFLLHPQLQEIYLGPADTGRPAAAIAAEFLPEATMTDEDVQSARVSYPSWLELDMSLLEQDQQWYRMKGTLPEHLSLTTPIGRQRFARHQAQAILEFLHSEASWGWTKDEGQSIGLVGQANGAAVSALCERSILLIGHAGALDALLPNLPLPKRPGRKHALENGQVRRVSLCS